MNESKRVIIIDSLNRIENFDQYYSEEVFSKFNGKKVLFPILNDYGVFEIRNLSNKYMFALDYLLSICDDDFIHTKNCFFFELLTDTFTKVKTLKSYNGYFMSRLWDLFIRVNNHFNSTQLAIVLEAATNADYLLHKLQDFQELISKSKYSKEILKYLIVNVKEGKLLPNEIRLGQTFSKAEILGVLTSMLLDQDIDYSYTLYHSSLELNDYDSGSRIIVLASKLFLKYGLYQDFIESLDENIVFENLHLLKLIFRVEITDEVYRSCAFLIIQNKKVLMTALRSEQFRDELGRYFSYLKEGHKNIIDIVRNAYENLRDEYSLRIKLAYLKILEENKPFTAVQDVLTPQVHMSMGAFHSNNDDISLEELNEMTFEEVNKYYTEKNEFAYFRSKRFISLLVKHLVEQNYYFLDNLKYLKSKVVNDVIEFALNIDGTSELPKDFFANIIHRVSSNFSGIDLFRFDKLLSKYKSDFQNVNFINMVNALSVAIQKSLLLNIKDIQSNYDLSLRNISSIFMNKEIYNYLKIFKNIYNSGANVKEIVNYLLSQFENHDFNEVWSFFYGTLILHLYRENREYVGELYNLITRQLKVWFFEGYITQYNLHYRGLKIIEDYILPDLNIAYIFDFENDVTISTLSNYYAIVYANSIYNLDFEAIFKKEDYVNSVLFAYQNLTNENKMNKKLTDLILFLSKTKNIYSSSTYERILFALKGNDNNLMRVNQKTMNSLIKIVQNNISTFIGSYFGYQFFDFLENLHHTENNITQICELLSAVLDKGIDCEYITSYFQIIHKEYAGKFTEILLDTIKENLNSSHWYNKIVKILDYDK